jgi:hypothetical protein
LPWPVDWIAYPRSSRQFSEAGGKQVTKPKNEFSKPCLPKSKQGFLFVETANERTTGGIDGENVSAWMQAGPAVAPARFSKTLQFKGFGGGVPKTPKRPPRNACGHSDNDL